MAKIVNPNGRTPIFDPIIQQRPVTTQQKVESIADSLLQQLYDFVNSTKNPNSNGVNLQITDKFGGLQSLFNSAALSNFDFGTLKGLSGFLNDYFNSSNQTTERNDALFSYLLQLISTNDQRSFDLKQLQDQRNYDSPISQLARLTGAGIGRDQAIQILQGGNGAGVAGSGAGVTAPGTSGVSGSMQQQAIANGIAGYQSLVGSFAQLLQTGVSIETAINQNRILAAQASMSESSLQGYTSADKVVNALQQMELSGSFSPEVVDSWTNADDMYKYFLAHRNDATISQLLQSGDFQTAFGSQSGREFINQFWKQRRSSRNDGSLAEEYLKQQKFQSAIMSLQPSKIGLEMENISSDTMTNYQELLESSNRIAVGNANIEVLNKQGQWIQVQIETTQRRTAAEIDYIEAQTQGQNINNQLLQLNYEYNSAGFPMLKQNRIDEITDEMNRWATINDPAARNIRIRTWLLENENALDAAYLENLRLNAAGSFATKNPQLWNLCVGFKASGASDYIRTTTGAAASFIPAGKALKPFQFMK